MSRAIPLAAVALALSCSGQILQRTSAVSGTSDAGASDASGEVSTTVTGGGDGCTPGGPATAFWSDAPGSNAIVADDTTVYWSTGFTVESCAASGCTSPTEIVRLHYAAGNGTPLAIDDDNIYFINAVDDSGGDTDVFRCPKSGCAGEPEQVSPEGSYPTSFLLDGSSIYFVAYQAPPLKSGVARIGKDLTGFTMIPGAMGLDAVRNGTIYWIKPPLEYGVPDGSILSCPTTGCADGATSFAKGLMIAGPLVVDDTNVYFTTNTGEIVDPNTVATDNSIVSCPLSGCAGAPTTIVSGLTEVSSIALDTCGMYWTTTQSVEDWRYGGVFMCERPSCATTTTIATGQYYPRQLAVESRNLFWVNYEGGNVMRVPR